MRHLLKILLKSFLVAAAFLSPAFPVKAQFQPSNFMNPMEHGPFVTSTISRARDATDDVIAHKGVAVKVGSPHTEAVMAFDTDLLRVASGWTGGFLHWHPARDGLEDWPNREGSVHFETAMKPGWSTTGDFQDPREVKYGPIPEEQGRYNGLYLHGNEVVFSYSVAGVETLERFGCREVQGRPVFTRTINLDPSEGALSMLILRAPEGAALEKELVSESKRYVRLRLKDQVRRAGLLRAPQGARWRLAEGHLILDLPPLKRGARFQIAIGPTKLNEDSQESMVELFKETPPSALDLSQYQQPGGARWETLETKPVQGKEPGPFAVDTLTVPADNPWNSFIRLTDVDFLPDGRAVVSSLSGDVWLVGGFDANWEETLQWKRFATGLYQPLGVRVVDGRIYVRGRDQITILHDRNEDEEADYYENFSNQVMASQNFHAFTMNLETDSKGNFYFAKATPWPPKGAEFTKHHGALFRLSPDGKQMEIIASGLRNPNGMTIRHDDEIVYSDNEGNWSPTSYVQRVRAGKFHGFRPAARMDRTPTVEDFEKPIVWTPHFVDNSPAKPMFIANDGWPAELQGQLLLASYGRASLSLILLEDVDGLWQGAHIRLPLSFKSGLLRGRFHQDGRLYLAGMKSWSSIGEDWGAFHRVRYTGRPLYLPVRTNTRSGGVELLFSDPLDPESALDPANYDLKQWTYPWTRRYGTEGKVYSVRNPGETGADPVRIEAIGLSEDGKSVFLSVPALQPGPVGPPLGVVLAIDYRLKAEDGTGLDHVIHKTIHRVPKEGLPQASMHQLVSADSRRVEPPLAKEEVPPKKGPSHSPALREDKEPVKTGRVVELKASGIELAYDKTEISAKAGERLTVRFVNEGQMAHNFVLVREEADIRPVGIAALDAHANQYIPENLMDRILAYTAMAGPGEVVECTFTVPPPGNYPYICTYSGHFTLMQGRLISKE